MFCDICKIKIEKNESVKTIDNKIICFGCDSKRLERENSIY